MEEVGFMDLDVARRQEALCVADEWRQESTPQVIPKLPKNYSKAALKLSTMLLSNETKVAPSGPQVPQN